MCVISQLTASWKLNGTRTRNSPSQLEGPTNNGDLTSWETPGTRISRRSWMSRGSVFITSTLSISTMLVNTRVNSTQGRPLGDKAMTLETSNPALQLCVWCDARRILPQLQQKWRRQLGQSMKLQPPAF